MGAYVAAGDDETVGLVSQLAQVAQIFGGVSEGV